MLQSQRSALTQSILKRLKERGAPSGSSSTPPAQPINLMGQPSDQQMPQEDQEMDQLGTQLRAPTSSALGLPPPKPKKKKQEDEEDQE